MPASAFSGVERGAFSGQFLAASWQQQLRQQWAEFFPGFMGEPAVPHSFESGARRFGILCRSLADAVGMSQTQICGGGAIDPTAARLDQKGDLLAAHRNRGNRSGRVGISGGRLACQCAVDCDSAPN